MASVLPSHRRGAAGGHAQPTDGDLAILELLTASSPGDSHQPAHHHPHPHPHPPPARRLPRREQPLDPVLIAAVIEGSAPAATRNHFGHEFQRVLRASALVPVRPVPILGADQPLSVYSDAARPSRVVRLV